MTLQRVLVAGSAALLSICLALSGTTPLGRILLEIGLPSTALPLLDEPTLRGAALFEVGRFEEAAEQFETAGMDFNQGVAWAHAGDYAAALVAWERALRHDPDDAETISNHRLITSLLSGTQFEPFKLPKERERDGPTLLAEPGQGKGRASGEGDDVNNASTSIWMPELSTSGIRRVPNIFDAQFIGADRRWLATLEDQPGVYLRARLAAEQKAREAAGTALPATEAPH